MAGRKLTDDDLAALSNKELLEELRAMRQRLVENIDIPARKLRIFELLDQRAVPHEIVGAAWGTTPKAVTVALHKARLARSSPAGG